jgi:hypothetical protein
MKKTISIDLKKCYESRPCQHNVTIIESSDTLLGTPVTKLTRAPEIVKMIVDNNLDISYIKLTHFNEYFRGEYKDYFERKKYEYINRPKKINSVAKINSDNIYNYLHKDPHITFAKKVVRKAVESNILLYKCDKQKNNFVFNMAEHPNHNKYLGKYHGNHYLQKIIVIVNKKIYNPRILSFYVGDTIIKKWYRDCLLSDESYTLFCPLLLERNTGSFGSAINGSVGSGNTGSFGSVNTGFKESVNTKIKLVIDDEKNIDNVFLEILYSNDPRPPPETSEEFDYTYDLLYNGQEKKIILDKKYYYSDIRIISDDLDKIDAITIKHNDFVIYDKIPPELIKKDNLLYCLFTKSESGGHDYGGIYMNKLYITIDSEEDINVKIYGKRHTIIEIEY